MLESFQDLDILDRMVRAVEYESTFQMLPTSPLVHQYRYMGPRPG